MARRVAELASTSVVKLPAWFPATGALGVARLKSAAHLLVEDRGRVSAVASAADLAEAAPGDVLSRFGRGSGVAVAADASVTDAWQILLREGVDALPVTRNGLLVGVVTRAALEAACATRARA